MAQRVRVTAEIIQAIAQSPCRAEFMLAYQRLCEADDPFSYDEVGALPVVGEDELPRESHTIQVETVIVTYYRRDDGDLEIFDVAL